MVDVYVPELEYNQNRQDQYFNSTKTGTLDVLGATLQDTFYYNPTNALDRMLQMQFGPGTTGNILSPEQYKQSKYYREGLTAPEEGIKEGYAQLLAENFDKRAKITQTLSRSKGGFALGSAQFGTMLLGSVLDPINVASAFIPVFPTARYAHLVSRFGRTQARAIRGVVEGSVGATLVEPIVLGQAALEQDEDYNLLDSFLNATVGGALGGGLHVGFGRISDIIERRSQKTKQEAIVTAVKQVLTDQEVNVPGIIKADLDKNIAKNIENEKKAAELNIKTDVSQVTRTSRKKIPDSLNAPKPKGILTFIRKNGRLKTSDPLFGDLQNILNEKDLKSVKNKNGLTLDEMAIRAQEEGFFYNKMNRGDYGKDSATSDDLIDLIDRESKGEIVFSEKDRAVFEAYESAELRLRELDELGIDPKNMTEEELDEAYQIATRKYEQESEVAMSNTPDMKMANTIREFDEAKTEAFIQDYNMGNLKQEYEEMVRMNAGIDDNFDLTMRESEIDAEIEQLEMDAENTIAQEGLEEFAIFRSNVEAAEELIQKADETYKTATDVAASCLLRNVK